MFNGTIIKSYSVESKQDKDGNHNKSEDFSTKLQAFKHAIKLLDGGEKNVLVSEYMDDGRGDRDFINWYTITKNS